MRSLVNGQPLGTISVTPAYVDSGIVLRRKDYGVKYAKRQDHWDAMTTLICKIPPNLPLLKGGITPL